MKLPKFSGLPRRLRHTIVVRRVSGASMVPTLRPQQIVVATALNRQYGVGDIVIFRHDGLDKIKRISDLRTLGPIYEIYVIGDNYEASTDSRQFGWLLGTTILGRVVWPRH